MEQMMECLMAKMKDKIKEDMKTNQETLARREVKAVPKQEEIRTNKAKMDAHRKAD
jgi:hypothetical protein